MRNNQQNTDVHPLTWFGLGMMSMALYVTLQGVL